MEWQGSRKAWGQRGKVRYLQPWNEVKMPQLSLRVGPGQKFPLNTLPFPPPPRPKRNALLCTEEEGSRKQRARERQGRRRAQPIAKSPLKGDLSPLEMWHNSNA